MRVTREGSGKMRKTGKKHRASGASGRPTAARGILLAGLAGSVWVAGSWGILSVWFFLPPILALTLLALGGSHRRVRRALGRVEKTCESLRVQARHQTEDSERRTRDLRTLSESALRLSRPVEHADLTKALAEDARELAGAAAVCLFVVDDGRVKTVNRVGDDVARFRIGVGEAVPAEGFIGCLLKGGAPVVVSDTARGGPVEISPDVRCSEMQSLAALPLQSEGRTFGGILLGAREPDVFTGEKVDVLSVFAALASAALDKHRLGGEFSRRVEDLKTEGTELRSVSGLARGLVGAWARELRTPLALIDRMGNVLAEAGNVSAGNLRRPIARAVGAETENARRIGRELERLERTRPASGEKQWSLESLGDLLREVTVSRTAEAARRKVRITSPASAAGPTVRCNRELVKDAVGVLLDCLMRGGRDGSTLSVDLECEPGSVRIVLVGECPDRFLETTERGLRGESGTIEVGEEEESLRLAMARWVFEHHGGTLGIEPQRHADVRVVGSLPTARTVRSLSQDLLQSLAAGEPAARILQAVTWLAADLAGARRAALLLLDSEAEELFLQSEAGRDESETRCLRVPLGRGLSGRVAATGEPLLGPIPEGGLEPTGGPSSCLAVPLQWTSEILGVLELRDKRDGDGFAEPDLHLARHLASLVGRSLARERDVRQVEEDLLQTLTLMASVAGRSSETEAVPRADAGRSSEGEAVSGATADGEFLQKEKHPC